VRAHVHQELQRDFRQGHRWLLALFSTQDVVQELFAAVVRGLADAEFEHEQALLAYLKTMVRNRLLDAVRFHEADKRDARRQAELPTGGIDALGPARGESPDLAAELAERIAVLREVLQTFQDRQRALLEMRLVDGATFKDICSALGYASDETARQAFWDAQAKLLVRLRARGVRAGNDTVS
jgi:RNA polymerase sigma factor (sigma-70 family)